MRTTPTSCRVPAALALCGVLLVGVPPALHLAQAATPRNFFANPSFEEGREGWHLDKAGKTDAKFAVEKTATPAGQVAALVTIGTVAEWGTQFGQSFDAGSPAKTYTFSVLARSTKGPVTADLQIERRGQPYDRAAKSESFTLTGERWTELRVTFKVEKPFPEGWFAYISCTQPNAEYRADMFRLVEGGYVPYEQAAREEVAAAGVSLFDTGSPAAAPLASDAIVQRAGWTKLPEDETAHQFRGDAVLLNDKVAVVLRQHGQGAELYALGAAGPVRRAVLAPAGADARRVVAGIVENSPASASLDATFRGAEGEPTGLRFVLKMGQGTVQTEARAGAKALRIAAPCRFLVLPDFFADDIVVDTTQLPVDRAELPSENFLLHLLGQGEAILMTVSADRVDDDVAITLAGQGERRLATRSVIPYGKAGRIWVACLEAPAIWHRHEVAEKDTDQVRRLDWTMPFPAQWRLDWTRADNGLTDSWEMILQKPNGQFVKHGLFGSPDTLPRDRKRWTTVLGSFRYPCWVDQAGQGWIQPLKGPVRFQGPALLYPVNRVQGTPLGQSTVADIARATLGVGPCEYILDLEGQGATYRGRATCSTRDTLGAIYRAGQQKQKRAEIEQVLQDVMAFVKHIRGRIEAYVDFGHQLLAYLDEQKKAHPELAKFAAELRPLIQAIDGYVAKRREAIQTPDYVFGLTQRFRRELLDYQGADAEAKCKAITEAIVVVGGNQDELVGECRMAVKIIRQKAGLAMASDPRVGEVAREVRRRAQAVLRNPAGHEAPRH